MPSAAAKPASRRAIAPKPINPNRLPASSLPWKLAFGHLPALTLASSAGSRLAAASIKARACSAADWAFAPRAAVTGMPRAAAAARSMPSTPVPCLAIKRSRGEAATTSAVTRPVRRMIASASTDATTRANASDSE